MDSLEFIAAKISNLTLKKKIIYDANGNAIYIGYGPRFASTSAAKWTVRKLYYDAQDNFSYDEFSEPNQIFDNYLSLTYS